MKKKEGKKRNKRTVLGLIGRFSPSWHIAHSCKDEKSSWPSCAAADNPVRALHHPTHTRRGLDAAPETMADEAVIVHVQRRRALLTRGLERERGRGLILRLPRLVNDEAGLPQVRDYGGGLSNSPSLPAQAGPEELARGWGCRE